MRSLKLLAFVLLALTFVSSATAAGAKPVRLATQDPDDQLRLEGKWRYDHRILEKFSGYWVWGICGSEYTKPC